MSIAFPGHSAPAAGFEVPLEMLAACHQRVLAQCETLQRLVPHLASKGPDEPARAAAAAVMRYFDSSARHHHEDEELDLFPTLAASPGAARNAGLHALTAALCADHRDLETRWQTLRGVLAQVAQGGAATLEGAAVQGFVDTYARHIEREEGELLPLAAQLLGDAELDRVGLSMRARRGLVPPDTPAT